MSRMTLGRSLSTNHLLLLGAAVVGVLVPIFAGNLVGWGRNIPQDDVQIDYLMGVAWACVLGATIVLWPVAARDKPALAVLWLIKSAVTLGFMLLYEGYYPVLDGYGYFGGSTSPTFRWQDVGLGSGTDNMMAFSRLHHLVLPPSYHMVKVSLSLAGLIAIYVFYRAAVLFRGKEDQRLLLLLALFPSVLFWSSIYGKDPLVLLGIAIYVYGVLGWHRYRRTGFVVTGIMGLLLAMFIRVWLGPILLLPLVVFALRGIRSFPKRVAFLAVVGVGLVLTVDRFGQVLQLETLEDLLVTTESVSRSWSAGGSAQEVKVQFSSIWDLVRFAPLGAFTALFRPLPGEVLNPFGLLAGLENAVLLIFLFVALLRVRMHTLRDPVVLWATLLVLTWAGVYGFVSYQNLGTAVRFKLQILPVLLGLIAHLTYSPRRSQRAPLPTVPYTA